MSVKFLLDYFESSAARYALFMVITYASVGAIFVLLAVAGHLNAD